MRAGAHVSVLTAERPAAGAGPGPLEHFFLGMLACSMCVIPKNRNLACAAGEVRSRKCFVIEYIRGRKRK